MVVAVSFCIDVEANTDNLYINNESHLLDNIEFYREKLIGGETPFGEIVFISPEQPDIHVVDELWNSILGLCFESIPNLAVGKTFIYSYFDTDAYIEIRPSGSMAQVSGSLISSATFDLYSLLLALYECGQRYIKLLDLLNHQATLQMLRNQAKVAKQSLMRLNR
jgi:hypothetical protein